jgi:exosortase A-associated hydrolase 1
MPPTATVATGAAAARGYVERALSFDCEGEGLVGVLAEPKLRRSSTGVLVVVGGPQYRAGSHRHFVQLSRGVAAAGWPVLRFDVRGMGDSSGEARSFEQLTPDIAAAIDEFCLRQPGLEHVVLWGLCDGASAALLYLDERPDPRVSGLVLLNPWVRAAETFARAQVNQYYARKLFDPVAWRSLLKGRIGWAAMRDFIAAVRQAAGARTPKTASAKASFQQRMARAWSGFGGPTLLVLSGNDLTAREFVERSRSDSAFAAVLMRDRVSQHAMASADHTLSSAAAAAEHLSRVLQWLAAAHPEPPVKDVNRAPAP